MKCVIEIVFASSVSRKRAFFGEAWVLCPVLEVEQHTSLFASTELSNDLRLRVSTGCVIAIEQLHKERSAEFDVGSAFEWLLLHELHHAAFGHFALMHGTQVLYLVSRKKREATPLNDLPKDLWHKVPPCLELQADHDALEMMLGDYSADDCATGSSQGCCAFDQASNRGCRVTNRSSALAYYAGKQRCRHWCL